MERQRFGSKYYYKQFCDQRNNSKTGELKISENSQENVSEE